MKQIKITQYSKPDLHSVYLDKQLYCVYTGKRNIYFKNEVKAKRFLYDSSRILTSILHSCNYLYYSLFVEYRKAWFLMYDNHKYGYEEEINNIFLSIDKSMNWLINRSGTSMNGNVNSFGFLEKILQQLLTVSYYLLKVVTDKGRYVEKQIIEIYINQINDLNKEINDWGKGMNDKFDFIKDKK